MEGKIVLLSLSFQIFFSLFSAFEKISHRLFLSMYVIGEAKHNIDELVDNLKQVMRLDTSQDECSNIIQILDSVVNVSKTSIGGIMKKL